MISLEAYRARIGTFYKHSHTHNVKTNLTIEAATFLRTFAIFAVIFILTLNLNFASFKLLKLLTDGDIESNPGPAVYSDNSLKIVQGSFHQGDPKFGYTAGVQCACNSLFAICWSIVKRVTVWSTYDLDYILENGDSMYKSLNTDKILSLDDLPPNVTVEGYVMQVIKLENESEWINVTARFDMLERSYKKIRNTGSGIIFFISGYTFALIWSKSGFFLCDSHSRSKNGYIVPDGTSILLKFKSLCDVQNYIVEVYLVRQNIQSTLCQLQYIYVHMETENDTSIILNCVNKNRGKQRKKKQRVNMLGTEQHKKIKAQKRKAYENLVGTEEHEKIKARMRERHENLLGTEKHEKMKARMRERRENLLGTEEHEKMKAQMRERHANLLGTEEHEKIKAQKRQYRATLFGTEEHEEVKAQMRKRYVATGKTDECASDFSCKISNFEEKVRMGPYFICVVCNRCLYRKSVLSFMENKYEINDANFFPTNMLTAMTGFNTFVELAMAS